MEENNNQISNVFVGGKGYIGEEIEIKICAEKYYKDLYKI